MYLLLMGVLAAYAAANPPTRASVPCEAAFTDSGAAPVRFAPLDDFEDEIHADVRATVVFRTRDLGAGENARLLRIFENGNPELKFPPAGRSTEPFHATFTAVGPGAALIAFAHRLGFAYAEPPRFAVRELSHASARSNVLVMTPPPRVEPEPAAASPRPAAPVVKTPTARFTSLEEAMRSIAVDGAPIPAEEGTAEPPPAEAATPPEPGPVAAEVVEPAAVAAPAPPAPVGSDSRRPVLQAPKRPASRFASLGEAMRRLVPHGAPEAKATERPVPIEPAIAPRVGAPAEPARPAPPVKPSEPAPKLAKEPPAPARSRLAEDSPVPADELEALARISAGVAAAQENPVDFARSLGNTEVVVRTQLAELHGEIVRRLDEHARIRREFDELADDELRDILREDYTRALAELRERRAAVFATIARVRTDVPRVVYIEMRPLGERRADDLVKLSGMYFDLARVRGWEIEEVDATETAGALRHLTLRVEGSGVDQLMLTERGLHRVFDRGVRTPIMVTRYNEILVYPEARERDFVVREEDFDIQTMRASGPGGQHVNTTDSAVRVRHTPSGIVVKVGSRRSQKLNKDVAIGMIRSRLREAHDFETRSELAKARAAGAELATDERWVRTYVLEGKQANPEVFEGGTLDQTLRDAVLESGRRRLFELAR